MQSTTTQDTAQSALGGRMGKLIIGLVIAALFVGAYVLVLGSFTAEGVKRSTPIRFGNEKLEDGILIQASVLHVDPLKGELAVRLLFKPQGALTPDQGHTLAKDLRLFINSASGSVERTFAKGKPMNPTDITVDLDGQFSEYPFDRYVGDIFMYITAPGKNPNELENIPVVVNYFGALHGYNIESVPGPEMTDTTTNIDIEISRAPSTVFFAVFVMIAQWVLALAVLSWALSVALRGRRIEATLFGWVGAMLFAFPALRSTVPGAPPIGALSDFLAFFWAEGLVAVAMLILATSYLRRPLK